MQYISNTDNDKKAMLETIGVSKFDDLLVKVPKSLRSFKMELPEGTSELELLREMVEIGRENKNFHDFASYLGAGNYDHFVPTAVNALAHRGEFITSYTPYQGEASQGTLQSIYEFQSLICELTAPDRGARLALVEQRAAAQGLRLAPDVVELLAQRITRDLRRLEGAVVRLGAYAALNGREITLGFAEQYAQPFFDSRPDAGALPVSRDAILERVADRFSITVRALKGRGRSPKLAGARRVAVHLLKTLGECSYSEVGALLGNRSHSTMVHAHQTLRDDLAQDASLASLVQQVARQLADA